MADDPTSQTNFASVGYRRPPAEARFRKGQSGNPAGRPKGSKNRPALSPGERLKSLMLEEAYRPIKVHENGEEITMPMVQAVIRSMIVAAVKSEARAQAMILKIVSATEEEAATIEKVLDGAREEAAQEPIEVSIVDAVGRPTGEVLNPYGGGPGPTVGKTPPTG